jgi:hypothetical protein
MDRDDEGLEPAAGQFDFDPQPSDETRRYWAETVWGEELDEETPLLFAERGAEAELCREIRLSELWGRCQSGFFTMDEFCELSTLISEVDGLRGTLCVDCAMLDRPNVSANWALANTSLCRGHLRFRLGHAQIDGGGSYRPV